MSSPSAETNSPGITFPALVDDVIGHPYFPLIIKKVLDVCGSNVFEGTHLLPYFSAVQNEAARWQHFAEEYGFKAACKQCHTSTDAIMFTLVAALSRVTAVGCGDHVPLRETIATGQKAVSSSMPDSGYAGNTEICGKEQVQKAVPISKTNESHTKEKGGDVTQCSGGIQRLNGIQKSVHVTRMPLSEKAKATLESWFQEHLENPYPTTEEKEELTVKCGVSFSSVNNWFGNKRMRIKRKMLQVESQTSKHVVDNVLAPRSKWNAVVVSKMSSEAGQEVLASSTGRAVLLREPLQTDEGRHLTDAKQRIGRPGNTRQQVEAGSR